MLTFKFDDKGNLVYSEEVIENVIAGDTDSVYLSLERVFDKKADPEEVIEFADKIGETVNADFPHFMKELFNADESRSNVIQTKREIVSDVSYFIAKKNYIMHIVDSEGVRPSPDDAIKYTGVEIKKADTPVIVQNLLKGLVDLIMSDASFDKIRDYYRAAKDDYMKQPIHVIGTPKNLKEFRKYSDEFNRSGSTKGFPQHAKGAVQYNLLRGKNDKKLVAGDSVKICYIKHPRLESIAFPADDIDIPDFIKKLEVDYSVMWSKVYEKIERYLKPMDWDWETRKQKRIRKLLCMK